MSDYIYSSARVRALESSFLSTEALTRLAESGDLRAAYAMLEEYGVSLKKDEESGTALREKTLSARLASVYREIEELTEGENGQAFSLWQYPYDCNNIKAAIKCFFRKISCREMLFDIGTVSMDVIEQMPKTHDFSALPEQMCRAAEEAMAQYAKTKNPQEIDFLLDRACYADMLEAAEKSGVEFAISLVRSKIDLINLVTCIRVMRMNRGEAGKTLLMDFLLDGGSLDHAFFVSSYELGERALWERLSYTDYKTFAEEISPREPRLTDVERIADRVWMAKIREARLVPYGAEVLIGFLLGVEAEVRNLRVILAGKEAGLPVETVMERIRDGYV